MSLFRNIFNMDTPAPQDAPVAPDAPLPALGAGETDSVQDPGGRALGHAPGSRAVRGGLRLPARPGRERHRRDERRRAGGDPQDRGGRRPRARDRADGGRSRRDALGRLRGHRGLPGHARVQGDLHDGGAPAPHPLLLPGHVRRRRDRRDRILAGQPDGRGAGRGAPGPQRDPHRVLRPDLRGPRCARGRPGRRRNARPDPGLARSAQLELDHPVARRGGAPRRPAPRRRRRRAAPSGARRRPAPARARPRASPPAARGART